jgi:PleD family two-component response regulator
MRIVVEKFGERRLRRDVLVVEADPATADAIQAALTSLGYRVSGVVSSGPDALRHARKHTPDVVIVDVKLRSGLDGVDAARAIRHAVNVPVVFITSDANPQTLMRAAEVEPYGFVVTPIRNAEVRCVLEIALTRHDVEARLREHEQRLAATLRSIAPIKDARGHVLGGVIVAGDLSKSRRADTRRTQAAALQAMAVVDDLTGLYNRRGFNLLAEQELRRALRVRQSRKRVGRGRFRSAARYAKNAAASGAHG